MYVQRLVIITLQMNSWFDGMVEDVASVFFKITTTEFVWKD
jgi:hypothetical protein